MSESKGPLMPTPDIDIGELRKLEKAADGLGYPHHARNRFREKLEYAAPALLAAAEAKDAAYHERDMVVAALSKCFPSYLARHSDEDKTWEDDWRWIVYIELPTGQASWHIHDSEREMFNHLYVRENNWDGHNTERKYQRLAALQSMHLLAKWEECERLERVVETCMANHAADFNRLQSRLAAAEAVVSAARAFIDVHLNDDGDPRDPLRVAIRRYDAEGKSE